MGKKESCNNKEQLKQELEILRALFDGVDELIYVSDPDTYEILFANKRLKELFGEKILGEKCYKVFQNLNHPCPFCTNKYIFGENLGKTHIWKVQNRKNKRLYRCIDKAIEWSKGKHVRFEMIIDITERKKAEERIRESEERYRSLFENARDLIFTTDLEGKITNVNKIVEEYGFKKDEVVGKNVLKFFPKKYWSKLLKNCGKVVRGKPFEDEIEIDTPKGKVTAEYRGNPIIQDKKVVGVQTIVRDITERKKIEKALKESEEKYRELVDLLPQIVFEFDERGNFTFANRKGFESFGYTQEDFEKGLNAPQMFIPEDRERAKKNIQRKLSGEKFGGTEYTALRKDGSTFPVIIYSSPIIRENKLVGLRGIVIDITERKRIEEALQESEQRFRSIVENSHDGILIVDDNFTFVYVNDELSRILGYPKEEIIGQDFRKFLDEDTISLVEERYLRRQRGEKAPSRYEFKVIRKDGEKRHVEIKSAIIRNKRGKVRTVAQMLDITERKKMEEQRKRFEERLSTLNTYGQSLNMAKSMAEIYKLTLDAMEKTLGFEFADILVVKGKMLCLATHRGYSKSLSFKLPLDGDKGVTVKAARTGKPIFVPDIRNEKAYIKGGEGIRSELAVPVKIGNKVLGVLNVESKRVATFNEEDRKLLEILASHAATAISNLRRQDQLRKLSKRLEHLMKSTTEIMNVKNTRQRLKVIAKAIGKFGWRRVVISLRDENLEGTDLVTVGLTKEEIKLLLERKAPGRIWRERLGPKFERFKINEFYYLPWTDPWIREYIHGVPPEAPLEEATTYAGIPSRLSPEEMVDWHPQDMLYAPLRTHEGRIVGILSMDDPLDGQRPTRESLAPLELFLHQAAMAIENAQLIQNLRDTRKQLEAYAEQLEQKVEERTRELKKSQEELLKTQRLAVIGELAGMVGHDLRNPLTSIAGATYYLKKQFSSEMDGKVKEMMKLIEKNIVYSNKIINDLLDYSGEIRLELRESNPKSITKETLSLMVIPKNIQVIDLTENKPKIKVDVEKMKRVFANIIKNAVDAMPKGGTLTIKSRKQNDNLEVVFSDTGVGMSKKTLEKLWTPLFTTKAKGMGFGLAICKRFTEAHGGSISVESALRKGTTLTVTIPIKAKIKGGEKIWMKPLESSLLTTTRT